MTKAASAAFFYMGGCSCFKSSVPERWRPVAVWLGAGVHPPAGAIMAGGLRRPRYPIGGTGVPGSLVLDGPQPVAAGGGVAGTPELVRNWGDPGRRPAAAPAPERRWPVPVRQGPGARPQLGRSWPGARGGPVPERRRPVPVWLGAGARPPAGAIMAGGPWRPRRPNGGGRWRCGWVPEFTLQLGRSWPGARGGPVPERRRPVPVRQRPELDASSLAPNHNRLKEWHFM